MWCEYAAGCTQSRYFPNSFPIISNSLKSAFIHIIEKLLYERRRCNNVTRERKNQRQWKHFFAIGVSIVTRTTSQLNWLTGFGGDLGCPPMAWIPLQMIHEHKTQKKSPDLMCLFVATSLGKKYFFYVYFLKKVFMYNKPKHFSLGQHGGGFYFPRHQHQSRKMKQINKMSKGCELDNSTNWSDRVCFLFILFFFIYETHVNQQHWWDVPTLASWSGQCPPSARCCKADQVEDLLMQSWAW